MKTPNTSPISLVFDLGGVLLDWDRMYLYRKLFPTEEEAQAFLDKVLPFAWHEELDGGLDFERAVADKQKAHPQFHDEIAAYHERWREMFKGVFEANVELVKGLKREAHLRLFALTNYPADKFKLAREDFPFLNECFEKILVSGEESLRKPHLDFYRRAEQVFGITPEEGIAFVDDRLENVAAANSAGWLGLHLKRPEDLPELLSSHKLLAHC